MWREQFNYLELLTVGVPYDMNAGVFFPISYQAFSRVTHCKNASQNAHAKCHDNTDAPQ